MGVERKNDFGKNSPERQYVFPPALIAFSLICIYASSNLVSSYTCFILIYIRKGGKKEECTTGAKMSIALETLADIISSNPARNKKIYSSNE